MYEQHTLKTENEHRRYFLPDYFLRIISVPPDHILWDASFLPCHETLYWHKLFHLVSLALHQSK